MSRVAQQRRRARPWISPARRGPRGAPRRGRRRPRRAPRRAGRGCARSSARERRLVGDRRGELREAGRRLGAALEEARGLVERGEGRSHVEQLRARRGRRPCGRGRASAASSRRAAERRRGALREERARLAGLGEPLAHPAARGLEQRGPGGAVRCRGERRARAWGVRATLARRARSSAIRAVRASSARCGRSPAHSRRRPLSFTPWPPRPKGKAKWPASD